MCTFIWNSVHHTLLLHILSRLLQAEELHALLAPFLPSWHITLALLTTRVQERELEWNENGMPFPNTPYRDGITPFVCSFVVALRKIRYLMLPSVHATPSPNKLVGYCVHTFL